MSMQETVQIMNKKLVLRYSDTVLYKNYHAVVDNNKYDQWEIKEIERYENGSVWEIQFTVDDFDWHEIVSFERFGKGFKNNVDFRVFDDHERKSLQVIYASQEGKTESVTPQSTNRQSFVDLNASFNFYLRFILGSEHTEAESLLSTYSGKGGYRGGGRKALSPEEKAQRTIENRQKQYGDKKVFEARLKEEERSRIDILKAKTGLSNDELLMELVALGEKKYKITLDPNSKIQAKSNLRKFRIIAQEKFRLWLVENGYDPDKITDEDVWDLIDKM
jgi:hypothetical protein